MAGEPQGSLRSEFEAVYAQIYSADPDEKAQALIKDAAAAGWSTDQFGMFLRKQPEYRFSTEGMSKALALVGALGLSTPSTEPMPLRRKVAEYRDPYGEQWCQCCGEMTPLSGLGTASGLMLCTTCRESVLDDAYALLRDCPSSRWPMEVPRKPRDLAPQLVYFCSRADLIKIGISVNPRSRVRELGGVLMHKEHGGRRRERELHERFAHLRTRPPFDFPAPTEWFRAAPELVSFIEDRQARTTEGGVEFLPIRRKAGTV